MIVIYETTLATSFPVAGLALILLRWALFDQKLWDAIGGVTSASPMDIGVVLSREDRAP